jgi:hypothetical protein
MAVVSDPESKKATKVENEMKRRKDGKKGKKEL